MNWKPRRWRLGILNASQGSGIGARHITVSTVGVLARHRGAGRAAEQFRPPTLGGTRPTDALRHG